MSKKVETSLRYPIKCRDSQTKEVRLMSIPEYKNRASMTVYGSQGKTSSRKKFDEILEIFPGADKNALRRAGIANPGNHTAPQGSTGDAESDALIKDAVDEAGTADGEEQEGGDEPSDDEEQTEE